MMESPLRICFLGPHGVGKTTIGRRLAVRLDAHYRPELGRVLRDEALAISPDAVALVCDPRFDERVLSGDLEADGGLGLPARVILETWHPGNLAYAQTRCPEIASLYSSRVRHAAISTAGLVVVPLTASREVLRARLNEPGGTEDERLDFFGRVADEAVRIAHAWNLSVLPALGTSRLDPQTCVERIVRHLGRVNRPRLVEREADPAHFA